jgi:outer membrane protein assembly factor BamB
MSAIRTRNGSEERRMKIARTSVFVLAALAVALVAPAPSGGAAPSAVDWPQFRFDDNRTGFNPFETVLNRRNVPTMRLDWQAQLGKLVLSSSPAVVGGVVYIGSSDGVLWAFPASGCGQSLCTTPLWQSTSVAQIIDSPTVADGIVYVGSQTSPSSNDGKLNAFDANGCGQSVCAPLWQGLAGPQSILDSSPAVANGVVFVGAFDGKLYAFDANGCGQATCQPLWTGATGSTIESSPTVSHGVAFIGSDDGKLYAFDANGCGQSSCQPLWTGTVGFPMFSSSPAISKGRVFIAGQHEMAAFKASGCGQPTCLPLWKDKDTLNFFGGSPAVAKGKIYIGLEDGLAAYAAAGCGQAECAPLFTLFGSGEQAAVLSSPTVANGVVYAGRNTGQVLAWSASCGSQVCSEIWSGETGDQLVESSPTVVNGTLYIGSADNLFPEDIQGRIYVFDLP